MSAFDKQVATTEAPKDMSLNDVLQFVRDVYSFCIPEGKEPGESAFNVLDYYEMELIGAFLKNHISELARLESALAAAREYVKRNPVTARELAAALAASREQG